MADSREVNLPLNVQIAIGRGWTSVNRRESGQWEGVPPSSAQPEKPTLIPNYDRSWCAMGPLIEQYGFAVAPAWTATHPVHRVWEVGSTPSEASARLLARLIHEGKLR